MPFAFMYAPSMLLVVGTFDPNKFLIATVGCAAGVVMIGVALTGYFVAPMSRWQQWLLGIAATLVIAPGRGPRTPGPACVDREQSRLRRCRSAA